MKCKHILHLAFFYTGLVFSQVPHLDKPLAEPPPEVELSSKQAIAFPNAFLSTDSEGFSATKLGVAYLPLYTYGDQHSGIQYQWNSYSQNGWTAEGNQLGISTKSINPQTALGYNINLNLNEIKGYSLLTTDSYYAFQAASSTRAEVFLSRDRVETQNSINNGIYYTLGGLSLEQQLTNRLVGIITAGNMYFSDSNTRPFFRVRAIYDVFPEYGITAQLRYRQYRDTNTNVPNNYFNPDNYKEAMAAVGLRRFVNGWRLAALLGFGRQQVNQDPSTGTQLIEINATSPHYGPIFSRTRLGYNKSAGFQGPDYAYSYFMQELIFTF
jgi:hypothetical protein